MSLEGLEGSGICGANKRRIQVPVGTISYQHHLTHPSVLAPGVGLFFVERGLLSLVENLAAQSSLVFLSLEVGLTE